HNPKTNYTMKVGDVVRHTDSSTEMTVIRLIGDGHDEDGSGNFFKSMDRRFELQGFDFGDPTCVWFEETIMKQGVFHTSDLVLVQLQQPGGGGAGAAAVAGAGALGLGDDDDDDFDLDDLDLGLDDDDLDLDLDDLDL